MHMHDGMCSALEGEGVNRKLLHFGLNTDNIGIEPMPMLSLNGECVSLQVRPEDTATESCAQL